MLYTVLWFSDLPAFQRWLGERNSGAHGMNLDWGWRIQEFKVQPHEGNDAAVITLWAKLDPNR